MSGSIGRDSKRSCLKLLQVSDAYHPHPGGVSEHLFHLTSALRELGHDAHVLAPSYPGNYHDPEWVHRIGRVILVKGNKSTITLTFDPLLPLKVRNFLRRERFDVVHTHCPIGYNLPYWALHYSTGINVATFHTAFSGRNLYPYAKPISRGPFKRLDGRIVVSQTALRAIHPHFPADYRIIGNGIDTRRFNPEVSPVDDLIRYDRRILFVGRLDPRKGLEYLIRALPGLVEDLGSVNLFIAGEGDIGRYLRLVDAKYHRHIHYLGYIPPDSLPSIYRSAEVAVFPSTGGESFGIVLLEAMASGVPVIASNILGYNEVITHLKDGYLVPPRDPEAIRKAVVDIFSNGRLRKQLVMGGGSRAREFDWMKIAAQIADYYHELIDLNLEVG
ncbi:glycosyltransferase family 1 protein [candidate division WOR-3 bacterium]|uniref:Glycosyltransferase family 1 protein n=1 Tax=candidate division WOR-3 bacterium TaxID=2052148 RepID=A0A660SNU3_UNCW3|nr:MAG: glycosyltransferase family 1 protein [candidate division WOR-3 bacterium]